VLFPGLFRRFSGVTARAVTVLAVLAGCLAVVSAGSPAGGSPAAPGSTCNRVRFPVTVAGGTSAQVSGLLCVPVGDRGRRPLQVLLAGATYDSRYWLLPSTPGKPSYVGWMVAHGQPVLAVDRPGTGGSGRPPADLLTMASEADAVHQVVGLLRSGAGPGGRFDRIVLVGHSVGTSVALVEAATHHDVDGVVASGFLHSYGPKLGTLFGDMHPAAEDPRFAGATEPPGYLTTVAGVRAGYFYDAADSSPLVIGADEATKSTVTTGEESTIPAAADPAVSKAVSVPVLAAVGENDQLFCGGPLSFPCTDYHAIIRNEQSFYSPAAQLEGYVLPGAGHVLNLHDNSTQWFAAANGWLNRHFPA
jgi:pimeloyl-ACP methyl ester carboxylesterase